MYRKIKNLFLKNFHWKLLSIFMATLLWFIVMNINNPTEIKTFFLNVDLLNENRLKENNIAMLNIDEIKNQKIEIKIKATRPIIDEVSQKIRKNSINIPIDLDKLVTYKIGSEPIDIPMPLDPNIPSIANLSGSFDIFSFSPRVIAITLDNIETIPKKVQININGKPKAGYMYQAPELSSEYINIMGARSIIDKVDSIYINVDVNGKSDDIRANIEPIAYDKDGKIVEDISFNMKKIFVKIPIKLQESIPILPPKTIGNVSKNSFVKSIDYYPKQVQVIGKKEDIQNLKEIELPAINISNLSSSKKFIYDVLSILKAHNLALKDNGKSGITVSIDIQKIGANTFVIPTSRLKISGFNDEYDVEMPKQFSIELEGERSTIDSLNTNDINCSINMEGLKEGEHSIKISVELPNGYSKISLSKEPFIDVVISKVKRYEEETSTKKEDKNQEEVEQNAQDNKQKDTEKTTYIESTTEDITDISKNDITEKTTKEDGYVDVINNNENIEKEAVEETQNKKKNELNTENEDLSDENNIN